MRQAWHIVTGEFPPAPGGVSDYTGAIASGLAATGDDVHVWCPDTKQAAAEIAGVQVHRCAGGWTRQDLQALDRQLDTVPGQRRLLVQWVPHSFGQRAMNLEFCRWIRRRSRAGDIIDLMVHEPFLPFGEGPWRHNVVAGVHRVMVRMVLGVARRVWISIPAWEEQLRPWAPGTPTTFCWLPVPSTLAVCRDGALVDRTRARVRAGAELVIGHFGTYDDNQRRTLQAVVPSLLDALPEARVMLLGRDSDVASAALQAGAPRVRGRLAGVAALPPDLLSAHLQACDLLVQPYADGASTRRTTLMAALVHGVPVATTIGRLSEPLWRSSPAVVAVAAGDTAGLLGATVALARDPERRRQQAAAGRALYAERFDISHIIETLRSDRCHSVVPDAQHAIAG